MRGWIPVPRTDFDSGLLRHPTAYTVFMYLRFRARIRPGVFEHAGHGIELSSGQVLAGRHRIANDLMLTDRQVFMALAFLKKRCLVKIESNNRYSIYTVVPPTVRTAESENRYSQASR